MTIENNKITADEGKEIYKISEPNIYGTIIILGINDSVNNWDEREKTIIEEEIDGNL